MNLRSYYQMSRRTSVQAALILVLICIPFQNCSLTSESNSTKNNSSGGNGWAYDKVYVDLLASAQVCADGSPVKIQINVTAGVGTLIRDNCVALPPSQQITVSYTIDPSNNRMIVYNGINLYEVAFTGMSVAKDSAQNLYAIASGGTNDTSGSVPKNFVSISKLNSQGLLEWSKFVPSFGFYNLFVYEGRGLTNGNMVYIGRVQDSGPSFLFVMDPNGQLVWARRYLDGSSWYFARGFVSLDTDGSDNIFAVGVSTPASGTPFVFLAKWNAQGDLLWQKQISDIVASPFVRISPSGEIFVVGRILNTGGYIARIDTSGNILSTKVINLSAYPTSSYMISLDFLKDGSLVLTGFGSSSALGTANHFIARMNPDGNLAWSQTMNDDFGTLPTRPIKATVSSDDSIFYSAVYPLPVSEPSKVGKVGHIKADGQPIKEILFAGDKSPTSVQSAVVTGANNQIWMAATTPTFFTDGFGRTTTSDRYGLLMMDPTQTKPCSTCTIWPYLRRTPASLNITSGNLTLTDSQIVFETPSAPLKFVDSPLPIPVLK